MKLPSEILASAEALMRRSKWCQIYECVATAVPEGDRYAYCLLGAVVAGTGWQLMPEMRMTFERLPSRLSAEEYTWRRYTPIHTGRSGRSSSSDAFFRNLVGRKRKYYVAAIRYLRQVTGAEDLQEWNDREDCSHDEVITALAKAKELALAEGL